MASSMPNLPVPRRSASLPVQKPSGADPQTEILYTLPLARIVQFKTSGSISKRASFGGDTPVVEEEAGTLSWVSRFERTIAVGRDLSFPVESVRTAFSSEDPRPRVVRHLTNEHFIAIIGSRLRSDIQGCGIVNLRLKRKARTKADVLSQDLSVYIELPALLHF